MVPGGPRAPCRDARARVVSCASLIGTHLSERTSRFQLPVPFAASTRQIFLLFTPRAEADQTHNINNHSAFE